MATCPTTWEGRGMTFWSTRWARLITRLFRFSRSVSRSLTSSRPSRRRARTVRWCRPGRAASWASWWSAAWRAWRAPEARRALALSKIRATATQRKRKKVRAKHALLPFDLPRLPVCPSCSPQIVYRSDGTFPPPVQQHNHCSRSCCHPHWA